MTLAQRERTRYRTGLTVELCVYLCSLGLAFGLRLLSIGRWPLLDGEAGLGLAAYRFARGLSASLRGHSPALFNLNTLLFFLTDGSDGFLRLWSVLAGSLLVWVPYALRRQLGRTGAMVSSLLLAVSPSFVFFSRVADGSVIVALCALACVAAVWSYLEERRVEYVYAAVGLTVVAWLSGPLAYTWLLLVAVFVLYLYVRARRGGNSPALGELTGAWSALRSEAGAGRKCLLVAGLLLLVLGAGLGANPAGLQMALDQFGQWVSSFQSLRSVPWYRIFEVLVLYEPVTLVLGPAGLIMLRGKGDTFCRFLRFWLVGALLFALIPGSGAPQGVLLVLLPLVLAAGQAVGAFVESRDEAGRSPFFWALIALTLGLAAAAYQQLAIYLLVPAGSYLVRVAALAVFAIATHAMVWSYAGSAIPKRAAAVSVSILLLLLMLRSGARLNYVHARDASEPFVGTTSAPDLLELARYAERFSSQLQGDPRVMAFQVDERLQVPVGWYLRRFPSVTYFARMPSDPAGAAVIAPAKSAAPARYEGMRFRLHSAVPTGKWGLVEWLRWWVGYRSDIRDQAADEVMLWVPVTQSTQP